MHHQPPNADAARQQAEWRMERELAQRTMRSNFNQDGTLRAEAQPNVVLAEYLHLAGIQWAAAPDGSDHCEWLSRLVEYVACLPETWGGIVGGPMKPHDVKVLHATAMLYCTGRQQPSWGPVDSDAEMHYAEVSAANAEKFFRQGGGDGTYFGRADVREDVCRLIFEFGRRFRLPESVNADKRLQVLADSVAFEVARYFPNTSQGISLMRERYDPKKMHTGWAQSKDNVRAWMVTRGWK